MAVKVVAAYPLAGVRVLKAEGLLYVGLVAFEEEEIGNSRRLADWAETVHLRRERLDLCALCCAPITAPATLCPECRAARTRASKRQWAVGRKGAQRRGADRKEERDV